MSGFRWPLLLKCKEQRLWDPNKFIQRVLKSTYIKHDEDPKTIRKAGRLGRHQLVLATGQVPFYENVPSSVSTSLNILIRLIFLEEA